MNFSVILVDLLELIGFAILGGVAGGVRSLFNGSGTSLAYVSSGALVAIFIGLIGLDFVPQIAIQLGVSSGVDKMAWLVAIALLGGIFGYDIFMLLKTLGSWVGGAFGGKKQ